MVDIKTKFHVKNIGGMSVPGLAVLSRVINAAGNVMNIVTKNTTPNTRVNIKVSEAREIARDGAKAQSNSGRGWKEKGDATLGPLLIDYKEFTESFAVSRKNWAKLQSDAIRSANRQPAFRLVLSGDNKREEPLRLWVIGDIMFKEMYEAWQQIYGREDA